jgi:hypothetical protein
MASTFGPEAISPTANATDDDSAFLTGLQASKLRSVLNAPPGVIRVITGWFVGNFTNITRIRIVRGREELASNVRAFGTAFDPRLVQKVSWGFVGSQGLSVLVTTGAGPAYDLYLEYEDVPVG